MKQKQNHSKARLESVYENQIRPQLQEKLKLSNIMEVPKISKVVINVGVKEAVSDSKSLQAVMDVVGKITGQLPVKTLARKSIATFKLREGMPIGIKVTLRRRQMYDFLDKLISFALPKVRDFQGVPTKCDGRGNYNLGIKDWSIFPEVDFQTAGKGSTGLNITIQTSAVQDDHALELLKNFGMPFKKKR